MNEATLDVAINVPLDSFDLEASFRSERRVIGLFGPSGAGKTTFLETIAGLRSRAKGRIACGREVWLDSSVGLRAPAERRGIGYVPQEHLLFPHWNVRGNLQAGFSRARRTGKDVDRVFKEVVQVLELDPLLDREVNQLSGGERQRVALGRALCSGPSLLMLDEPLAALDWELRHRILPFLLRVKDAFRVPMLVVSHNPVELLALCDEVIAMKDGKLVAQGLPTEVFTRADVYSHAARNGFENLLRGRVVGSDRGETRIHLGPTEGGQRITAPASGCREGDIALAGIRAQDIMVSNERIRGISARDWLSATVKNLSIVEGKRVLIAEVEPLGSGELVVELTEDAVEELALEQGRSVWLFFKSSAVAVYGARA